MKVLITSGGCKVPIDDVRHIGNFSSGAYGALIATEFYDKGNCEILFIHEKGSRTPFGCLGTSGQWDHERKVSLRCVSYKDYSDYLLVKETIKMEQPDIIISVAAISDYICDKQEGKISSDGETMTIQLRKAEKVIASFRELAPEAFIVGFKCLVSPTEEEKLKAIDKLTPHVHAVVYNDLAELRKGNQTRCLHTCHRSQAAHTASDLVDKILKLV